MDTSLYLQQPAKNGKPVDFFTIDFYENRKEFLLELENTHGEQVANWLTIEDAKKLRDYLTTQLERVAPPEPKEPYCVHDPIEGPMGAYVCSKCNQLL